MKAISLWQPWATAMALGLKQVETRHWSTKIRGPVAIHAAMRWTLEERELAALHGLPVPLPLGAIVAVGELVAIYRTEQIAPRLSAQELAWGNYGPGRFGWVFERVAALPEAIPFKGAQGFFDVPDDLVEISTAPDQGRLL